MSKERDNKEMPQPHSLHYIETKSLNHHQFQT